MAKETPHTENRIIIKKYANRRLYNTDKSSYVTLDDLACMVRQDKDFIVIEAKSGDDITHAVLTQIIFEEENKGEALLPVNFLRQLIAFYGDGLQSIVPDYLESSMAAFASNQEKFRSFVTDNLNRSPLGLPPLQPFEEMAKQNMAIFEKTLSLFSPFPGAEFGPGSEKTDSAKSPAADDDRLAALQDQLAAMQAQMDKIQKK